MIFRPCLGLRWKRKMKKHRKNQLPKKGEQRKRLQVLEPQRPVWTVRMAEANIYIQFHHSAGRDFCILSCRNRIVDHVENPGRAPHVPNGRRFLLVATRGQVARLRAVQVMCKDAPHDFSLRRLNDEFSLQLGENRTYISDHMLVEI